MARTTINSLGIPADTIVSADLDYPLTDFSSTGIDDNASSTSLTIDSSGNISVTGTVDGRDLATDGTKLDGIAASATNYGDSDVATYISGNRSYGNITTTGYIAGPSTFTIDPAAVGDNTGTLVIAGNLQVDGTTTTINSTTVNVDDLNIQLATGAANAAAANGAGITVDGPVVPAKITYNSTPDEWTFNKNVRINIGSSTTSINELSFANSYDTAFLRSSYTNPSSNTETYLAFHTNTIGAANGTVAEQMRIAGNKVGIGTGSPTYKLVVSNSGAEGLEIDPVNVDGSVRVFAYDRSTTSYIPVKWFADSHEWSAGGSSTWMTLDNTGNLSLNGNLHAGLGNDQSMTSNADGMIQIDGNAYMGAITMDATAMYLYHNSASRNLVLATNETAQLTLDYNGNVELNRGSLLVHDSLGSIDNALRLTYGGNSGQGDINVRSTGGNTYLRILTSNAGTTNEVARFTEDGNFITQKTSATQQAGIIQHNSNDYMYLVSGTNGLIMGTTAGTHRIRLDTSTGDIRFHTPTAGQGMTLLDRGALCLGSTDTTSGGTASKLSVVGNIDLNGSPGSTNVLRLYSSSTEKGQLYAHAGGVTLYAHNGSETNLYSNGTLTMQISDGNKVQINATGTPTYTLEVAGTNNMNFRIMPDFQQSGLIRIGRSDGTNRWHDIVAYNDSTQNANYVAFDVHNGTVSSTYRAARIQGDGTIKAGGGLQAQLQRATGNVGVINTNRMPVGHYTPGETVFEIDPTWSSQQIQDYFNLTSGQCTWVEDSTAPGGYAIKITGNRSVGGNYSSGFPYIPVDQNDIFYMECWIKNTGGGVTGHYMGSIDYSHTFASLGGNPGSFGYWVMSNYTTNSSSGWYKVSGYITGFGNNVGQFESGTKYWTPQALFNYRLDSGSRECYISGWKVIKVYQPGNRTFANNVTVNGTLSKTSGSFKIDHPLPSMANTHHLVHSFIEGPRADLIYSDTVQLSDGVATVNIDEYATMTEGTFETLCKSIRCFTSNEDNWDAVKGSVTGNILTIECQNSTSNANVSWIVIGERKDPSMIGADWTDDTGRVIVEPEKTFDVLNAEYLEAPAPQLLENTAEE